MLGNGTKVQLQIKQKQWGDTAKQTIYHKKNGNIKNLEKQRRENIKTFKIVWEVIFAKLHAQKKLKMREHVHETKM